MSATPVKSGGAVLVVTGMMVLAAIGQPAVTYCPDSYLCHIGVPALPDEPATPAPPNGSSAQGNTVIASTMSDTRQV